LDSLTELKQIIDSMKARIENDSVDAFHQHLSIIAKQHTDKAAMISVIKIMQSIGIYLGSKKDNADKDAVPVLNFIVTEFEKLEQNPDLNKEQTDRILSG